MPLLNHQSSKPESSSCSPVSDLFQRSPFAFVSGHFLLELQKRQPQDFSLRQATSTLYRYVFSLPWLRGILPVFYPLALIRMLPAFYYDVPGVSHGHQTTVFD